MGWLDSVESTAGGAINGLADSAKALEQAGEKALGSGWNGAVDAAKAAANSAATAAHTVDAAKEQVGAWIDSGEKSLEKKVDDGRAWLRENGGILGQQASDQIGFVEGGTVALYDAGKGLVQLLDGVGSLSSPIEWAANPNGNIARVKSAVNTVETLGRIAGLASPTSWAIDPQGNAQLASRLAGALWHSAATSFENDPAKFTGNAFATIGTMFIPGADAAEAAGDVARVTELATDASKATAITGDVSKAAAVTEDVSEAAARGEKAAVEGAEAADKGAGATAARDGTEVASGESGVPKGGRAVGAASGRPFDPEIAGGPIEKLSTDGVRISHEGIDRVAQHIERFGPDDANEAMVKRLRSIANGDMPPTEYDLNYYTHELRECERYTNLGWERGQPEGADAAYELWNNAHSATLEDYGLKDNQLYHPDALK